MSVIRSITDLGRRRQESGHQRLDAHLGRAIQDTRSTQSMSMERALEKMRTARTVVTDVAAHLEARADALIARGAATKEKAEETFSFHDQAMDQSDAGLDELDEALRQMGNGQPAGSEDSEKKVS